MIGGSVRLMKHGAFAGCALAIGLASPALAQEQPAAPGDIVVTAQRREQRLADVPISLTAVRGEALRARSVPDTEGAFASVPNVDISRTRNSGTEWNIAIRGVSTAARSEEHTSELQSLMR